MGRRKRTYRFGGGGVTPVMAEVLELPPVVHLLTVCPEANPSPTLRLRSMPTELIISGSLVDIFQKEN